MALPGDTKLFDVPDEPGQIFDRDLCRRRGIPKKTDADGRTLDVHCLRHTFATLLSKSGVLPRHGPGADAPQRHPPDDEHLHAPAAHRHAGAVETLPSIPSGVLRRPGWSTA